MKEGLYGLPEEMFTMGSLILKYVQGEISTEEKVLMDAWIAKSEKNKKLFEELTHKDLLHTRLTYYYNAKERKAAASDKVMAQNFPGVIAVERTGWRWRRMIIAAAILLLIVSGAYFLFNGNKDRQVAKTGTPDERYRNDIVPGRDGAILKLGNDQLIVLDTAADGNLARQGNIQVMKNGGVLTYNVQSNIFMKPGASEEVLYNTLITPKGRQFQVVLPDGSKVWLNAASSITFPAAFVGKERKVEITGEAYFEVAPLPLTISGNGRKIPFLVKIITSSGGKSEVEVLGTHFNINAYDDEAVIKTTLLEGSVKVKPVAGSANSREKPVILKPGQQAVYTSTGKMNITVINNADLEQIVAWKNGSFHFKDESLETIMQQLARWYDVEVIYEGDKQQDVHFGGIISRNTNLSEVLKMLELSDVHFKIEGKKIIAVPKQ